MDTLAVMQTNQINGFYSAIIITVWDLRVFIFYRLVPKEEIGISCRFLDSCVCGYRFVSSNVHLIWERRSEGGGGGGGRDDDDYDDEDSTKSNNDTDIYFKNCDITNDGIYIYIYNRNLYSAMSIYWLSDWLISVTVGERIFLFNKLKKYYEEIDTNITLTFLTFVFVATPSSTSPANCHSIDHPECPKRSFGGGISGGAGEGEGLSDPIFASHQWIISRSKCHRQRRVTWHRPRDINK